MTQRLSDVFFLDADFSKDLKLMWVPLRKRISLVTNDFVRNFNNTSLDDLKEEGLTYEEEEILVHQSNDKHIYLSNTTDCNLRCLYCYAKGGFKPRNMDFDIAKKAIDYISESQSRFKLSFLGGGEPTLNFDMLKKSVEYAKEVSQKVKTSVVTNNTASEEKIKWLADNMDNISVSWDGPKDIQDYQRPFASGQGSSEIVEKNLKYLINNDKKPGVRSTISSKSVSRMKDMVEYLHDMNIHQASFEPLFSVGRCEESLIEPPVMSDFLKYFIEAKDLAKSYDFKLSNSTFSIGKKTNTFCGAEGRIFGVTPEGHITACVEVGELNDPASSEFIYGKIDETGVHIDEIKLQRLKDRTNENLEKCKPCITKYNCAGGCAVKAYRTTGNLYDVSEDYCELSKSLATHEINRIGEQMWKELKVEEI